MTLFTNAYVSLELNGLNEILNLFLWFLGMVSCNVNSKLNIRVFQYVQSSIGN